MSHQDTVQRIVDSAAALFAERGFTETSLRTITSTADVNLAAVNYHFGSKKGLIQSVFAQFIGPLCKTLNANLDVREQSSSEPISVDEAVQLLFESLFESASETGTNVETFMKLLGLAYTQSQEHLRHFIIREFGQTYARFMDILKNDIPNVDPVTFYWRLYFMLGASVFSLSSYNSINNIAVADYGENRSVKDVVNLLSVSMVSLLKGDNFEISELNL